MDGASYLVRMGKIFPAVAAAVMLAGCGGGSRLLDEPIASEYVGPLATASDDRLEVKLEHVIVQDGPGSWARDAFWDEYQFSAASRTTDPLHITRVELIDAMGNVVEQQKTRSTLEKSSKDAKREYAKAGVELVPGNRGNLDVMTPTAVAAGVGVASGMAGAAMIGSTGLASTSAIAAPAIVGSAAVFAVPVLAVGGIMKTTYNEQLDDEIQERQTHFPLTFEDSEPTEFVVFLPIGPSPSELRVHYVIGALPEAAADEDDEGSAAADETSEPVLTNVLTIPVADALDGLHLPSQ